MTKYHYPPGDIRPRYPKYSITKLIFASILGFGLGMGTLAATADTNPDRPILTKSGQRAAIQAAAAAVRNQGSAPAEQLGAKATALGAVVAPQLATSPVDQSKIPHYFGPFPNWANSPSDHPRCHRDHHGRGYWATATATVGAGGAITDITITNPGVNYVSSDLTGVVISGAGTGATATARVTRSDAVLGIDVATPGGGYTAPVVAITDGGNVNRNATATAFGGVDAIPVTHGGSGYTFPTVDVDLPDGPDGLAAVAYAVCGNDPVSACGTAGPGTITDIIMTQPGSGYLAPGITVRDGTISDPIRNNPGTGAEATSTLAIQTIVLDIFGAGYDSEPTVTITDDTGAGSGATATARIDHGGVTSITITSAGSNYLTTGGIKKFQDTLPKHCDPSVAGSCPDAMNNLGQYIPVGVPDTTTFPGLLITMSSPWWNTASR